MRGYAPVSETESPLDTGNCAVVAAPNVKKRLFSPVDGLLLPNLSIKYG